MGRNVGKILIDSDVLIDVLRGQKDVAEALAGVLREHRVGCSVVTVAELFGGMRPAEERATRVLISQVRLFPVSSKVAELAGRFLNEFGRSHGVDIADALIGATSVIEESRLWTWNRRHYPAPRIRFWKPSVSGGSDG